MTVRKSATIYNLDEASVREELSHMEADATMRTEASYSANSDLYPDHLRPFPDKHIAYLKAHPNLNPQHYLANLRLMIRIR